MKTLPTSASWNGAGCLVLVVVLAATSFASMATAALPPRSAEDLGHASDGVAVVKVLRIDEFEQSLADGTSDVWYLGLCRVLKLEGRGDGTGVERGEDDSAAIAAQLDLMDPERTENASAIVVFRKAEVRPKGWVGPTGQMIKSFETLSVYRAYFHVWHVGARHMEFLDHALELAYEHYKEAYETLPPVAVALEPNGIDSISWGPTFDEFMHDEL